MKTNRLEAIARRQRSGRRLDLIFACFVASGALLSASTIAAAMLDVSAYVV
jgi:hypothetical protein